MRPSPSKMAIRHVLLRQLIWISCCMALQARQADDIGDDDGPGSDTVLLPEVSEFIPDCAAECYKNFLDVNHLSKYCTQKPSLSCLCAEQNPSGLTVGEAAVQCIVAADQLGSCGGMDVGNKVIKRAYEMCNDADPDPDGTARVTLAGPTSIPSIGSPAAAVAEAPIPTPTSSVLDGIGAPPAPIQESPGIDDGGRSSGSGAIPSGTQSPDSTSSLTLGAVSPKAAAWPDGGQVSSIVVGVLCAISLASVSLVMARRARKRNLDDLAGKRRSYEPEYDDVGEDARSAGKSTGQWPRRSRIGQISAPLQSPERFYPDPVPSQRRDDMGNKGPVQSPTRTRPDHLADLTIPRPVSIREPHKGRWTAMTTISAFLDTPEVNQDAAKDKEWRLPPPLPPSPSRAISRAGRNRVYGNSDTQMIGPEPATWMNTPLISPGGHSDEAALLSGGGGRRAADRAARKQTTAPSSPWTATTPTTTTGRMPSRIDTRQPPPTTTTTTTTTHFVSPVSAGTATSHTSSLLAGRVSEEQHATEPSLASRRWARRERDSAGPGANVTTVAPPPPQPRARGGGTASPEWQPTLTPTRRGDEMYLGVR